ncbi:MAG: zinc ribbon domain-containing protein [Candidatus Rokubacteria bacterium]|nr:zinc ribbon domain-containing protein [Candidatus Rokubacteria bacterium]MBI3107054.1 zinc ribbon domain-containing protein [Candidatus Rokubacteria bacterium]
MSEARAGQSASPGKTRSRWAASRAGSVFTVPASLSAFGAPPRLVTATVLQQSSQRRATRALAALGGFWGLAAVAVFLPVVHFVLVPSFLAAGAITAGLRLREDRRLLSVRGACPRCGVEQEFLAGQRFRREQTLACPRCHDRLTLTADPAVEEMS